jgi:DHA2 family lincomycin resistance protein-like MFS transporter
MSHPPAASAGGAKTSAADMAVLRWLVGATFIVILNETIMANALPKLQEEFGVSERASQWLTTAFLLTMAVVIPITGWFLQRVTTRQAFGLAMATFCTGTLIAALAPTSMFWVLIAGRIVQASGTAVMMPLLMTTLMSVVPASDRGRVMGNVTLAMSVAPAMGPAVSGLILQFLRWPEPAEECRRADRRLDRHPQRDRLCARLRQPGLRTHPDRRRQSAGLTCGPDPGRPGCGGVVRAASAAAAAH